LALDLFVSTGHPPARVVALQVLRALFGQRLAPWHSRGPFAGRLYSANTAGGRKQAIEVHGLDMMVDNVRKKKTVWFEWPVVRLSPKAEVKGHASWR
jgi:hypothetical protein